MSFRELYPSKEAAEERAKELYEDMIMECEEFGITIPKKVLDDIEEYFSYDDAEFEEDEEGKFEYAASCVFAWVFVSTATLKGDVQFPRLFLRECEVTDEEYDYIMSTWFDLYFNVDDWYNEEDEDSD